MGLLSRIFADRARIPEARLDRDPHGPFLILLVAEYVSEEVVLESTVLWARCKSPPAAAAGRERRRWRLLPAHGATSGDASVDVTEKSGLGRVVPNGLRRSRSGNV